MGLTTPSDDRWSIKGPDQNQRQHPDVAWVKTPPAPRSSPRKNRRRGLLRCFLRGGSLYTGYPVLVNDLRSSERKVDFAVFFIVLWSYGRKYALLCAMGIQKIHMAVHIFSGFALFTELLWVCRGVESLCKLLAANKCLSIYQQMSANQNTVRLKSGSIWKFSREWLFWTGYASGGSLQKKRQSPTVKY